MMSDNNNNSSSSSSSSSSNDNLHIVSFNVAGWKTTLIKINNNFGTVENWLVSLKIDILCLQEVKMKKNDADKTYAEIPGYESFWSFPNVSSVSTLSEKDKKTKQVRSGLNGCTTFVRKGLVTSANCKPLEDDFDNEGRVVLTEHGNFVVYNVYVPFSGVSYDRFCSKMYFLELLDKSMDKQRKLGKKVILCGDLNTTSSAIDCSPAYRYVNIKRLLTTNPINNDAIQKLQMAWPAIHECLDSVTYEYDEENSKFKIYCNYDEKKYFLGSSNEQPIKDFFFGEVMLSNDGFVCKESSEYVLTKNQLYLTKTKADRQGQIPVSSYTSSGKYYCIHKEGFLERSNLEKLYDVVQKHNEIKTGKQRMHLSNLQWDEIVNRFGAPCHSVASVEWLNKLLSVDSVTGTRMVDSFRATYPSTNYRFTCWDQSTNCRYQKNVGNRIDYILVDADLWDQNKLEMNDRSLHNGVLGNENDKYSDYDKALRANTANGKYKEVTPESKGLTVPDKDAIELHIKHPPHTGMIYTPPDYSDHIAVSILIKKPEGCANLILANDSNTKECQPTKKQTSITSFFTAPAKKQKLG